MNRDELVTLLAVAKVDKTKAMKPYDKRIKSIQTIVLTKHQLRLMNR